MGTGFCRILSQVCVVYNSEWRYIYVYTIVCGQIKGKSDGISGIYVTWSVFFFFSVLFDYIAAHVFAVVCVVSVESNEFA